MVRKSLRGYLESDGLAVNMVNQERFVDLNFVDYMEFTGMQRTITKAFEVLYPDQLQNTNNSEKFYRLSIRDVLAQISIILREEPQNVPARKLVLEILVSSMFSVISGDISYHDIVVERLKDFGAISVGLNTMGEQKNTFFGDESGENEEYEDWDDIPFK